MGKARRPGYPGCHSVHECAPTARRNIQPIGRRVVGHGDDRPGLLHQRDTDAKLGNTLKELLGPVQRVHHPHPRPAQPLRGVHCLLRQPAVLRECTQKSLTDASVCLEVSRRHRIVRPLFAGLDVAFVVPADDGASLPGRRHPHLTLTGKWLHLEGQVSFTESRVELPGESSAWTLPHPPRNPKRKEIILEITGSLRG